MEITNGPSPLGGAALDLNWPTSANAGPVTPLIDTKTAADWAAAGPIDLATTGLFLGNAFNINPVTGTWSGTITLTYEVGSGGGGNDYSTWAATFLPDDVNDPAGDNDSDGLSNLLEFAFGTNPTISDAGSLSWDGTNFTPGSPVVHVDYPGGGGVDFTARFIRRTDHGDSGSAAYAWQFSSDLGDW